MSKLADKFKEEVQKYFNELQEFAALYNKKSNAQREEIMTKHKEAFQKDPNSIDIKSITREAFYLGGFYQADIRKLQYRFLDSYLIVKSILPKVEFEKEVEDTAKILKESLPKQVFTVDNGDFKEIEEGTMDKLKKDFDDKGYYKLFENQLKTILKT